MAPSPTGKLHLGTAYATLWPYLFARKNKGEFILRIEDTDTDRSEKEFTENILEGLVWLGFSWDGKPYFQTDRLSLYKQAVDKLTEEKKAYLCFCTKEELDQERKVAIEKKLPQVYSGKCRNLSKEEKEAGLNRGDGFVYRFKLPENRGIVKFSDLIHGDIEVESSLLGDMVIMRQNGIPLYNFAVVVDDLEMEITHVIRGEDHLSNTPKQILFFESLDETPPLFAHYPVILNQDRIGKLSKRTGSMSIDEYKKEGFLPEAIVNFLALLGWCPKDSNREIFSISELINEFDIKDMNKSAGAWNPEKLEWINGEYIRSLSDEELTKRLQEFLVDHPAKDKISSVVPLIKSRIKKLSDFIPLTNFIFSKPVYDLSTFESLKIQETEKVLTEIEDNLNEMKKPWSKDEFESNLRNMATEFNISPTSIFQLIRVAISGQLVTPPLFETIELIGEVETLNRIKEVINKFKSFS